MNFPRISKMLVFGKVHPTDLIWRNGTPFAEMTGRTALSSAGFRAEVSWNFPQL